MAKPIQKMEQRIEFSRAKMIIEQPLELGKDYLIAGRAQCIQVNRKDNDNQDGTMDVIYSYVVRFDPTQFKIE